MTSSTELPDGGELQVSGRDELPDPKWTDDRYGTITTADCFDDDNTYDYTQYEYVIREKKNANAAIATDKSWSLQQMR